MKKFLATLLIAGSLFLMPTADAVVQTYEGTDEYIMSEFETIDIAKQRAKQKAERVAQESAGVFVEGTTEVSNLTVTKDEIRTMTCGILKIVDVHYDVKPLENANGFLIRATVKADVDTEDIAKWLSQGEDDRLALVAQNIELQIAIAAQDAQIAELKKQIAANSKPQDKEKITQEFAAEDKIFLSNQQLAEAGKFYYNGDLSGAANLCTRALELNPSNAAAYSIRGAIYYRLNDYNSAIADYNRAIELNPSDYKNFYNRGLANVKLQNYQRAAEDFDGALKLNPNDEDSRYNRDLCYRALGYRQ